MKATEILTPEQAAHVRRIQNTFASVAVNLPLLKPGSPRAIVVLLAAAWLRYAALAHPEWSHQDAVRAFQERLGEKYVAGVEEHGGNLWEKPGMLDHLAEELIDAVAYTHTADEQRR